jgi:FkbM family methyltransferase
MKLPLRSLVAHVLRCLPASRDAYAQQRILEARTKACAASSAAMTCPTGDKDLSSVAQIEKLDPKRLENEVPIWRTLEERVAIAMRCRDADILPKVANAGAVLRQPDGTDVQIMHNGIRVIAGGYYGAWMQDLITRCLGHHEPQEEVLFAEIMKHVAPDATMVELGGFWSFYSIWFQSLGHRRRSIVVEADPAHLEIGRINAKLNDCEPTFISAFVGRRTAPPSPFATEKSGMIELPCVSVPDIVTTYALKHLDLLHCDVQGAELDVLESCAELAATGRLGWVVVSTHTHHISHDPLTHQRCVVVLRQAGATILAEHDVHESFSGDGLIVAKFGPVPDGWRTPRLSYNRYSESLLRNPLYDLAAAAIAPPPALPAPTAELVGNQSLDLRGGLFVLTRDSALGRVGDNILLPFDQVMFPATIAENGWALETLEFLEKMVDPACSYVALDIGANVGLFTRQVALRFPNLMQFFCVEAEPGNFRALQYNVSGLRDRVKLWNVALSDADGPMRFFRDKDNIGNYSLNDDAMRGRQFDSITVQAVATDQWMAAHVRLEPGDRVVWKSDTQGYDELIISLTPLEIWDKVDFAIVELWRIRKPNFDRTAFRRRIDMFRYKSIGSGNCSTTNEILEYLTGDDWCHSDLYLWH